MSRSHLRIAIVACSVGTLICLFVAIERYQANAWAVEVTNQTIGADLEPAVPTATKYALLFGVLLSGGAIAAAVTLFSRSTPCGKDAARAPRRARSLIATKRDLAGEALEDLAAPASTDQP